VITICQVGVAVLAIMALRSIAAKTVLSDTNAEDAQEIQVQFRTAASLMMALPFPLMMTSPPAGAIRPSPQLLPRDAHPRGGRSARRGNRVGVNTRVSCVKIDHSRIVIDEVLS
jgi:hypothetical protein